MRFGTALADAILKMLIDAIGNQEFRVVWPLIKIFRKFYFLDAQRFAVRFILILFVRGAVTDVAVHDDERGLVGSLLKSFVSVR